MAEKVAKFEKVSVKEFTRAMTELFPNYEFKKDQLALMLREIPMPRRSTSGSVGFDFFAPFEFVLRPGTAIMIPTGIRVRFEESDGNDSDWGLAFLPKSGIGTKTSIRLSNTIGLIDCDYYYSPSNEGHIMIKMEMPAYNPSPTATATTKFGTPLEIVRKAAKFTEHCKFVQAVFFKYGITIDDDEYEKEERNGGFGSTGTGVTPGPSFDDQSSGNPFTDDNAEEITDEDLFELLNS